MAREYSRESNILAINKCAEKNNIDYRALEADSIRELANKIHCLVGFIRGKDEYISEGAFREVIADEFQDKYSKLFDEGVEIENDPLSKKSLDSAIELFEILKGVYYEINDLELIIRTVTINREHVGNLFFGKSVRLVNGTFDYGLVKKVTGKNLGFRISKCTRVGVYCELIEKIIGFGKEVHVSTQSTHLKGIEFELEVARSYMWLGYEITMTKASGDFGVDVVAVSNSEKIGIQCKNLSSPVGVDAIMQVSAGARFYDCTKCCVITTQGYTEPAIEMANKLGVEILISRWR
ncbi:Restriction endonuclease [compost metagenome]